MGNSEKPGGGGGTSSNPAGGGGGKSESPGGGEEIISFGSPSGSSISVSSEKSISFSSRIDELGTFSSSEFEDGGGGIGNPGGGGGGGNSSDMTNSPSEVYGDVPKIGITIARSTL